MIYLAAIQSVLGEIKTEREPIQLKLEDHLLFVAEEMDRYLKEMALLSESVSKEFHKLSEGLEGGMSHTMMSAMQGTNILELQKNMGRYYSDLITLRRLMSIAHGRGAQAKLESLMKSGKF